MAKEFDPVQPENSQNLLTNKNQAILPIFIDQNWTIRTRGFTLFFPHAIAHSYISLIFKLAG